MKLTKGAKAFIVNRKNGDANDLFRLKGKVGILDSIFPENETPDLLVFRDEAILLEDYEVELVEELEMFT
jgi:hypothetical protein